MGFFQRRADQERQDLADRALAIVARAAVAASATGPDELRTADGRTIGLFSLRERLQSVPPAQHSAEIERYVRVMLAATSDTVPVGLAEVEDRTYPGWCASRGCPSRRSPRR